MTASISQVLNKFKQFKNLEILDVEILLAHVLGKNRTYLVTRSDELISSENYHEFLRLINLLSQQIPVAYLIGKQEFWSLDFKVNKDTLIPRADTETLVATALDLINHNKYKKILDLGTGSGCIALALASEVPNLKITAVDNSLKALKVARENARNLQIDTVKFIHCNWFENIKDKFDLIVSNPPYVASNDHHLTNLSYEPQSALVSGRDGLDDIKKIIQSSKDFLKPIAHLVIEHGFDQGLRVRQLFHKYQFSNIKTHLDLAKNERVTTGKVG